MPRKTMKALRSSRWTRAGAKASRTLAKQPGRKTDLTSPEGVRKFVRQELANYAGLKGDRAPISHGAYMGIVCAKAVIDSLPLSPERKSLAKRLAATEIEATAIAYLSKRNLPVKKPGALRFLQSALNAVDILLKHGAMLEKIEGKGKARGARESLSRSRAQLGEVLEMVRGSEERNFFFHHEMASGLANISGAVLEQVLGKSFPEYERLVEQAGKIAFGIKQQLGREKQ